MSDDLVRFAFSHFNENARWSLDRKGSPSQRRSRTAEVRHKTGKTEILVLIGDGPVIDGPATRDLRHVVAHLYHLRQGDE